MAGKTLQGTAVGGPTMIRATSMVVHSKRLQLGTSPMVKTFRQPFKPGTERNASSTTHLGRGGGAADRAGPSQFPGHRAKWK